MKIEINKIPEEGYWLDAEEAIASYHVAYPHSQFATPVSFHVFISKVSHELLVQGDFSTKATLECSRCLKNFVYPIQFDQFTFCEPIEGRLVVDLTETVREDILISIPLKPLCRESCKGLCTQCGQDLNLKECGCKKGSQNISFNDLDKLKFD